MSDEQFKQSTKDFSILFDQVIKNGGKSAGPLITRLTYLSNHNPKIREALQLLQDKTHTLLNTPPGSTIISMGFRIQVDDPYAGQENAEAPKDSDLMTLLLNGTFQVVGPELTPDRGRDEDKIIDFGGLKIMTSNYKLKDRLTPPVNDFLMAALMVIAISDPDHPNEEFARYGEFMLINWNDLARVTAYLKAVLRTTATGHFPNVNAAIEQVTLENASSFDNIQLPKK